MENESNHNSTAKRTGTINVKANMNCNISLDDREECLTENASCTFTDVPFGRHVLKGTTHRHIASKEIFLSLPALNVKLVLEERGGTLVLESDTDPCRVSIEGENYECPTTIENLKRGVYPVTVSGEGFQFTDKIRVENNRTTRYRVTKELADEKEKEAAFRHYQHALEMPEATLRDRKRKISALDEILVNENRFDLTEGIETHRRLVKAIRQDEIARETMTKAIQIEKIRKKKKYGLILSIAAIIIIIGGIIAGILIRSHTRQKDELAYRSAVQSGSPADYLAYLKNFGKKAAHYTEAKAYVDRVEQERQQFDQAKLSNTIPALEKYLKEFGSSARYRKEAETALKKLKIKKNFPTLMKELQMVTVPAGNYFMGASPAEKGGTGDNRPPVWVKINPFAIGRHEVTFDEYDAYCKETGRPLPNDSRFGRGKHPVINVSWNDAMEYCRWLSEKTGLIVRLPSEAEWEFACRSRRMSIFFWGNEMDHRYCVSGRKKHGRTRPVESTTPNDFGLYDMSGNVYEWCSDRYQDPLSPGKGQRYRNSYRYFQKYDKNESGNPVFMAWGNRRALRGGSFRSSNFSCRSSHRFGALPETKRNDIGFRIAVTIPR